MTQNVILFLVRSDPKDVELVNRCLESLDRVLKSTLDDADLLFFVEESFAPFRSLVRPPLGFLNRIIFQTIDLSVPPQLIESYGDFIDEYFPHPTHSNGPLAFGHPGFNIGYRSMCRFFSGEIYKHPILKKYISYMRLDSDSEFVAGADFSLFEWFNSQQLNYSFIRSAIQLDDPKVVIDLRSAVLKYVATYRQFFAPKQLGRLMYYTNFEIGNLNFFRSSEWMSFHAYLDSLGGYYSKRWGDAPVRYAGLWATCSRKKIKPIPAGFRYFHGDYFDS
jgi:hypothetical protein